MAAGYRFTQSMTAINRLFQQMKKASGMRNSSTRFICISQSHVDDIKDLLAGTKTGRLILDRLTINCIIKAFCEKYEPDEFIEQIKGREKEGCQIASNTCPHCGTIYHSFGLASLMDMNVRYARGNMMAWSCCRKE